MEEKKCQILHDIHQTDSKEESVGLDEDEWRHCSLLQEEYARKVLEEEIKWKQQSKNKWLEGDRNTKFFHGIGIASARRRANHITAIFSQDQLWGNRLDIENEIF